MFAAKAKRSMVPFLFAGLLITAMVTWIATLGWGLILLSGVLS